MVPNSSSPGAPTTEPAASADVSARNRTTSRTSRSAYVPRPWTLSRNERATKMPTGWLTHGPPGRVSSMKARSRPRLVSRREATLAPAASTAERTALASDRRRARLKR